MNTNIPPAKTRRSLQTNESTAPIGLIHVQHTYESGLYSSLGNKRAILFARRVYVLELILTVTTRTSPSLPACVSETRAIGQCVGTKPSSLTTTTSPSMRLREGECHLRSFWRVTRYSDNQRCQKCLTRAWQRCHHFKVVRG